MATKLLVAVETALKEALEQKLVDFDRAVVTSRVEALLHRAEEAGFTCAGRSADKAGFSGPARTSIGRSLPYLIVYAKFHARYSSYTLEAAISVWNDGEVTLSIYNNGDVTLFWARAFISGAFAQTLNIDRLLRG